jgi:hypothetical protein
MPVGVTYEQQMETVNKACEQFDEEDRQWIREEMMDISGLNSVYYWQGIYKTNQKGYFTRQGVRKIDRERIRVLHNIFIEKGLKSPYENYLGLSETKHNPDKKRGGKKKKGGRRRI